MNNLFHSFFCVWFFLLVSGCICAQQNVYISHIAQEQGIRNKRFNSIAQDSSGLIWFGIFGEGLANYDGNKIRRVRLEGEDRYSERRTMFCADSKFLYLNSNIGLEMFDPVHEKIVDTIPLQHTDEDFHGFDHLQLIHDDNDTLIWALEYSNKMIELDLYSRSSLNTFYVFLSKNGSPFKRMHPQQLLCKGVPILKPYKNRVLLKSEDNFLSMDDIGKIYKHKVPEIDIGNIYDQNVVIQDDSYLWILSNISCNLKPPKEVTLKQHYEYVTNGSFLSYNLLSDLSQLFTFEADSRNNANTSYMPFQNPMIQVGENLIYNFEYSFSLNTKKIKPLVQIDYAGPYVSKVKVTESYLIDHTGVIWMVGDFGLVNMRMPETGFTYLPHLGKRSFVEDDKGKVHGNVVDRILETKKIEGGSLSSYDPNDGKVEYKAVRRFKDGKWKPSYVHWMRSAIYKNQIYAAALIIDSEDGIAVGYTDSTELTPKGGEANILIDSKKRLWKSLWGSELVGLYDLESMALIRIDTLPDFVEFPVEINDSYERTSTGNIWLASNGKGIYILPQDKGEIIHLRANENSSLQLQDNVVSGLYEDDSGIMWIGHGLGLSRISKDLKQISHYPFDPSLDERRLVYSILPDDNDNFLWLSTDKGVYRYDIKNNTYSGFPLDPMVMDTEYNRTSFLKTTKGQIFYGGLLDGNRTLAFYPEEVIDRYEKEAKIECPVILSDLRIYRKEIGGEEKVTKRLNALNEITLNPGDRYFDLEFQSSDFRSFRPNYYAHFLEGYDNTERFPTRGLNKVRYENLPPGDYTLVLNAGFNAEAAKNNQRKIKVKILPFWYQTMRSRLFALVFLGGCFVVTYRLMLGRKMRKQEEKRVRDLDELKSRLYTNITHEFRTPLTVILGMNDNIQGNEEEKSLIKRNAKNLLQLINQLLNLTKLDAGRINVNDKRGDIVAYIQYLTESFYSMASERKIDINFSANTHSFFLFFDETKIQHIVFNLISNAIKFTRPGGKVSVELEVPHKSLSNSYSIIIRDTGIGIDEDHLAHIFERFYQIQEDVNSGFEGTGIGLAYVKELVELMNGKVMVNSKKSWGTEFEITLPLSEKNEKASNNVGTAIHSSNDLNIDGITWPTYLDQIQSDKPIILIVEDNSGVIAYIKSILKDHYHIEVAINGLEGIERAKEIIPDIILSDVMMPEKSGFEVLNELKNNQNTSHIPIVMLTAKADLSSKIMGFEYGADAYLSKPFEKEELLSRIKNLLIQRKKLQDFYSGVIPQLPVDIQDSLKDHDFLENINKLINEKVFDSDFSASEIPEMLLMSNTQFYRKLKALTGQSPSVYVRKLRLKKAIELLEESDLNISEIAFKVGFNDPNYFTRIFKKEIGRLPGSFRSKEPK